MNWFLFSLLVHNPTNCHVETAQGLCCETACAVERRIDSRRADLVLDICVRRYGCYRETLSTDDFCSCYSRVK